VWIAERISSPTSLSASVSANAQRSARVGVERRQDPVAGGLHEPATEALNLPAGDLVVSIEQATPPLVSDRGRALRGM